MHQSSQLCPCVVVNILEVGVIKRKIMLLFRSYLGIDAKICFRHLFAYPRIDSLHLYCDSYFLSHFAYFASICLQNAII